MKMPSFFTIASAQAGRFIAQSQRRYTRSNRLVASQVRRWSCHLPCQRKLCSVACRRSTSCGTLQHRAGPARTRVTWQSCISLLLLADCPPLHVLPVTVHGRADLEVLGPDAVQHLWVDAQLLGDVDQGVEVLREAVAPKAPDVPAIVGGNGSRDSPVAVAQSLVELGILNDLVVVHVQASGVQRLGDLSDLVSKGDLRRQEAVDGVLHHLSRGR